ncbi:MAG: hypothetical protein AB9879_00540 [Methanothrix sp.]
MIPSRRALQVVYAICLIFLAFSFSIDLAVSDVPAVHSYDLEYVISNALDYRDFDFYASGIDQLGNISSVPINRPFKADPEPGDFRLNAIRKSEFDERVFNANKAEYIKNHAIPSNSTFPSTANYEASISVLPDTIFVYLRVDDLSEERDRFNLSWEKALYRYPDGYQEEMPLGNAKVPFPPHHYTRPGMPGGFESLSSGFALIILAFVLNRP